MKVAGRHPSLVQDNNIATPFFPILAFGGICGVDLTSRTCKCQCALFSRMNLENEYIFAKDVPGPMDGRQKWCLQHVSTFGQVILRANGGHHYKDHDG